MLYSICIHEDMCKCQNQGLEPLTLSTEYQNMSLLTHVIDLLMTREFVKIKFMWKAMP